MRALYRTALVVIALVGLPESPRADLGLLVADGVTGPYRVSVLVSPAPLRVGRSQWSVLVQDASGGVVENAEVEFSWSTEDRGTHSITHAARAGSHPFYRSSEAVLPVDGHWLVELRVRGAAGSDALAFDVLVSPGLGPWRAYWPALIAPLLGIGLFALHQSLRLRARQSRA